MIFLQNILKSIPNFILIPSFILYFFLILIYHLYNKTFPYKDNKKWLAFLDVIYLFFIRYSANIPHNILLAMIYIQVILIALELTNKKIFQKFIFSYFAIIGLIILTSNYLEMERYFILFLFDFLLSILIFIIIFLFVKYLKKEICDKEDIKYENLLTNYIIREEEHKFIDNFRYAIIKEINNIFEKIHSLINTDKSFIKIFDRKIKALKSVYELDLKHFYKKSFKNSAKEINLKDEFTLILEERVILYKKLKNYKEINFKFYFLQLQEAPNKIEILAYPFYLIILFDFFDFFIENGNFLKLSFSKDLNTFSIRGVGNLILEEISSKPSGYNCPLCKKNVRSLYKEKISFISSCRQCTKEKLEDKLKSKWETNNKAKTSLDNFIKIILTKYNLGKIHYGINSLENWEYFITIKYSSII